MSIPFACPTCSHTHTADESLAGKKARCRCGTILDIPFPNASPSPSDRAVVQCTACSKKLSYPTAQAGKLARCGCGQTIRLPEVILKASTSLEVEFTAFQTNEALENPYQARPLAAANLNIPNVETTQTAPWAGAANWIRTEAEPYRPSTKPTEQKSTTFDTIPGSLVLIGVLDCVYALLSFAFGGLYLITGGFFSSHSSFAWYGALTIAYSFYNFGCMIAYGCSSFFAFNKYPIGWYVLATVHAFGLATMIASICLAVISFQVSLRHVVMLFSSLYGGWVMYALFQEEVRERFQVDKPIKSAAFSIGIPGAAFGAFLSLGFFVADFIVARQYPTGMPWQARGNDEPDEVVDPMEQDDFGNLGEP
jgi:hypothetical protein